ncbi:spore germination protein [Brassicibacter mesophilus]|uniref:spore germination protein n=1 Tax=Brassicibacter mesophilus TaxID=745119 RepID=UPI003D1BE609
MGLFNRLFKKNDYEQQEKKEIPISLSLETNIENIKEIFKDCDDVVYRDFLVGVEQESNFALIYVDGLIDKVLVTENVLKSLMLEARGKDPEDVKQGLYDLSMKGNISATEIKEVETLNEIVDNILVGETVLLINGYKNGMIIGSRGWPIRGLSEPQSETVIRGPRDGLNETLKVNTSLIRRRVRDPKLKLKNMQIGVRSKTDISLMYMEDIANKELVKEVKTRLENIDIDAILESSYIEQLIEDNHYSPFPQIENTERPDAVAAALYEGRVAIVVDNTPFTLLVPSTLATFMQSSEDYYDRWLIASVIRILRYIAALVSMLAPALYIAVTSYHPGIIPTQLALYIAATRVTVPFPAIIEAFIMEITIEFLREAGTRLSGPIGTTIGIVGGLVIGQAAVEAGIVSPLMVIIVAVTTISSFMLPSYGFAAAFRILRFVLMVFAGVLGLYGIMLGIILIGTHLVSLQSFGVPYMAPFSTLGRVSNDLKDTIVRVPLHKMKQRPKFSNMIDKDRMNTYDSSKNNDDSKDGEGNNDREE